jgi:hypothetical protein
MTVEILGEPTMKIKFSDISSVVVSFLCLLTALSTITLGQTETVIFHADLTKGNPGFGQIVGGSFEPQGWVTKSDPDSIRFQIPNGANVKEGYIEVEMTNFNPAKATIDRNQFISINEDCDTATGPASTGLKFRLRVGKKIKPFEIRLLIPGGKENTKNQTPRTTFNENDIYKFRLSWNAKGLSLSLDGKEFWTDDRVVKGFCTCMIGEGIGKSVGGEHGNIIGTTYRAVKLVSLSGGTPQQPISTVLSLLQGWNLISLPIQPSDTAIEKVLSSINGKYNAVYAYDGNKYEGYVPGSLADLKKMEQGRGYWIHMTVAANLNLSGTLQSKNVQLKANWNLVGYNSMQATPVQQALSSISGKFSVVYGYDAASKSYIGYVPGSTNNLSSLEPGKGYWIFATENVNW